MQQGEGEKPKRSSLPKGLTPDDVTLEKAIALLSLPREVAKHPTSGEPILAGIGRYGSYVQHGKTYANLGKDDDVLEIGGNRAIDLIVAKESGAAAALRRGRGPRPRRPSELGGAVTVKSGRFGPYVNHGKINATLPKGTNPDALTLDEAVAALAAKAERPRARRASARRASRRRPDHRARRPLRRLCQLGQGQRDDPEIDVAGHDHRQGRAGIDRRARGQAVARAKPRPRRRRRRRRRHRGAKNAPAKKKPRRKRRGEESLAAPSPACGRGSG